MTSSRPLTSPPGASGSYHQRVEAMLSHLTTIEPQLCFTDFVDTARALGFTVMNQWNPDTNLPVIAPLH